MKKFAEWMLLASVALWGSSFALTKPLLDHLGVFTFMGTRFMVGGILLILFLLAIKRFKLDQAQLRGGLITGTLLFTAFVFHTYGLKYTTVAKNAFIVGSSVIFVPFVLAFLFKKRQTKSVWFSTVLAVIGLGLVTLDGTAGGVNFGDFLTLLGTLVVVFYILTVEKYVTSSDPLGIASIQVLTVGLLSLIPAFLLENPFVDLKVGLSMPLVVGNLLVLSVGCTSVAYVLANYAQTIVPATRTALLYVFEPIFGALLGLILLGEAIGLQGIVGAGLITFATVMPQLIKQKEPNSLP